MGATAIMETALETALIEEEHRMMRRRVGVSMRALVFNGPNDISLEQVPVPLPGFNEALVRVTLTTICGTDVHIVKGEYPVERGLVIGHEAVGVIEALGPGVTGYDVGDRVLVGAITPCGQCDFCLSGAHSQCGGHTMGGWRFGNSINGVQADYFIVPFANANMAKIPDELADEQVILLADIASTGIAASETGGVKLGDAVVVFAQGPIGLCATTGARLRGAAMIIAVESDPVRKQMARRMGANVVLDPGDDVVAQIRDLTHGAGVDVAIEALGTQATFEAALRSLRPGGTLSSLGVYSGHLAVPLDAFAAGLGDHKIVTTLCPGGKDRMRRLMELVRYGRLDLRPLLTHRFALENITDAYKLFSERRDGVIKVAIRPRMAVDDEC